MAARILLGLFSADLVRRDGIRPGLLLCNLLQADEILDEPHGFKVNLIIRCNRSRLRRCFCSWRFEGVQRLFAVSLSD